MIVGTIHTIQNEMLLYPKAIQKGIQYLLSAKLDELQPGNIYPIEGDAIFAKASDYMTEPASQRAAERHEKFIDIQYILSGSEKIGIGRVETAGPVKEDALASKDFMKYNTIDDEVFVTLTPGTFVICYPWDVHRANCNPENGPVHVKKILVKVAVDSLQQP
ncbi:MAG: YhcH/YjgK/YiaL family protein [Megasphaera sp.]|jgi:biofilm protein TabA|uniref:YhcH/YjgK/YiaL family protein n=2 Tax=Megasphaera TaxID=906 RepID=UPI0025B8BF04|nr:YhcH/YjgK/YiaL family protein [Megasphaera sp.]MCF0152878.1 YhcH/YjgK/YiaL family protein [Megasphaera sp.]MCI7600003.1 YhcH/YjgK/YiaL family protein [Megasphaera sp.]